MTPETVRFLSIENILAVRTDTIQHEGGPQGIRDVGLLESAVAMPQSQFGGRYLHEGLAAMAAAYQYHLCRNHAFIDGNKRAAAFAALLFLRLNGVPTERLPVGRDLERITLAVASGAMAKGELIAWLRGALAL